MVKLAAFKRGGVHPDDKKRLSKDKAIEVLPLPSELVVSMSQHLGAPATPVKKKGDEVKRGEVIGTAASYISADVHSPVDGTVIDIRRVRTAAGAVADAIVIKPAEVQTTQFNERFDWETESSDELLKTVRSMGIVGMGGAGFPTPVKATIPEGKKVNTLIVNGIECEAFLTADDRLMVEKAEEIIIGAKILNKALGIQNAIIAIDENKPQAIKIMKKLTRKYVGVNVRVCESKYPQGAEKQLIKAITGREVPSGKLPIDVHCIVQNVGTVHAIYEAVQKNKPLYERIITVTGDDAAEQPQNFRARIGTPASFLINQVTKHPERIGKVIFGGGMMGVSAVNMDAPVTKLTSGILLLNDEDATKPPETACIRCARCADACPMGLRPFAIATAVRNHDNSELKQLHIMDCIECGTCSFICPARIPLLDYCKLGKMEIRKQKK